ncbi:hypothetical protein [Formosa haliotis]|uniref:hypothetical protein n=1 Tax=Formosa haliotis TaxID=1555194 RepID=UPI0008271A4F|nr:hypothetical protein [Formosa haliotis]
MKTNFLNISLIATLLLGVMSCNNDDDMGGTDPVDPTENVITGDITEDMVLEKGNYTLKGNVQVHSGATLTIEKGSTITVTSADQAAGINLLMVLQGGKLIANGTADEPIVFTSENKNAEGGDGDWGGITLHGYAPMNATGGTSLSEAGQQPYGGTDAADSSGSLKYVIVEYAGQASSDGEFEFNAFSFFACGSGTIVENCEAFEGADDGFEFYGGTVNAKNLSMVGMEDDSIDWDEGFQGSITNAVIYQYDNIGDYAFELANRSGENNASPRSNAAVKDVTVRASNRDGKAAFDLKQGTAGTFDNIIVSNTQTVMFVNNQLNEINDGTLKFTNAKFTYSENEYVNNVDGTTLPDSFITSNGEATGADESVFDGWSNYANIGNENADPIVISGNITEDLFIPKGNHTLKGAVTVQSGATLTIEKGSTITVTSADQAAGINLLMVLQGGKLVANGTADEPIVFTSENKNAEGGDGDWGGITLHGYAPMNASGGTSLSEAGQQPYGGTDAEDSSGSLKYVIVEYAGQASSDGEFEFNAFSFFACGSETIVENCEAFEGADDGFEFYGGTVNAKNLSMVGMEDDSIDWDEGFQGSITNAVIYQYDNVGDYAFELANRSGENNASPRSNAAVKDVTVRASNRDGKAAFDLKQGTAGSFDNIVVTNAQTIMFVNNQLNEVNDGTLVFTNANFSGYTNLYVNNVDGTDLPDSFITENSEATGADATAFDGWSNYSKM